MARQWYLHLYDVMQADLNWENPRRAGGNGRYPAILEAKGIKGFRFDVINVISKPEVYEDDFEGDGRRFYTDGRNVHKYLKEAGRRGRHRRHDHGGGDVLHHAGKLHRLHR